MGKLKAVIRAGRSFTLLFPALSGIMFSLLALKVNGELGNAFDYIIPITAGSFALLLCNFVSNLTNAVTDKLEDSLHPQKKNRPVASGELTDNEALYLVIIGIILIMFCCSFVNQTFTMLVAAILVCAMVYSIPPIRLKRRLFMNNFCMAISRGLIGVLAAVSIVTYPFILLYACIGIILSLFVFGANTTKDLNDKDADSQAGVLNFVTYLGVRKAMVLSSAVMLMSYITLIIFTYLNWLPFTTIYLLLLLPLGISMIYLMCFKYENMMKNEQSYLWFMFYGHVMLYVIGFVCVL